MVAQNVLLAAESIGLCRVYIGGIRNDPEVKHGFPVASVLHQENYQTDQCEADIATYDGLMKGYYGRRDSYNRLSNWST